MASKFCYRKIEGYKYQLTEDYKDNIGIKEYNINTSFIRLAPNGELIVKKWYAWDGASGPTIDTLSVMRGSLVHDVIYQLIRMELLPYKYKKFSDKLLRKYLIKDGTPRFRAWYFYLGVKLFGGSSARPGTQEEREVICI